MKKFVSFYKKNFISLKSYKKNLALFLAIQFFISTVSSAAPLTITDSFSSETDSQPLFLNDFPTEIASIHETFTPVPRPANKDKLPFVVHIQDAHANPDAQGHIRDTLEWLNAKSHESGKDLVVGLEGTIGNLHPEYLDFFPNYPETNEAFVEYLHEKGELTGAELFAWQEYKVKKENRHPERSEGSHDRDSSPLGGAKGRLMESFLILAPRRQDSALRPHELHDHNDIIASPASRAKQSVFYGIETAELYRENLSLYRELLFKREEMETALKPLRAQFEIAKSKVLNPALRDFLREMEKEKQISTLYLVRRAKEILEIDLDEKIEQIRFSNLARFAYVHKVEKSMDAASARKEWIDLKRVLKKTGTNQDKIEALEKVLQREGSNAVSPRSVFEDLAPILREKSIDLAKYPHYTELAGMALLTQEIETEEFFQEADRLAKAVRAKLAVTEAEKNFLELADDIVLFEKLLQLKLTREEYKLYQGRKEQINPDVLIRCLRQFKPSKSLDPKPLSAFYQGSLDFYKTAGERDHALLDNALRIYSEHGRDGGILVLIAGGFHTDGLAAEMRQRGISYAVLTPRIGKVDDGELYSKVLRRENADLTAYLGTVPPLTKQESLFLKGLIEKVIPMLKEKYNVPLEQLPARMAEVIMRHPVLKNRLRASLFPGREKEPFVRLGFQTAPAAGTLSTSTLAVSEVYALTDADLYPDLADQRSLYEKLMEPGAHMQPVDFWPQSNGSLASRQAPPTLESRIGQLKVQTGSLDPLAAENGRLIGLAARQMENFRNRGVLNSRPQTVSTSVSIMPKKPARAETRMKIGIVGLGDAGLPTAVLLSQAGHDLTVIDEASAVNEVTGGESFEARILQKAQRSKRFQPLTPEPENYNVLVRDHQVIYIAAELPIDSDYGKYKKKLEGLAMELGNALKVLRESGDRSRRVFVIRAMVGVDTTEELYGKIKWHVKPPKDDPDYLNFDMVYQPDFTWLEEGKVSEPYVMFGVRNLEDPNTRETIALLDQIHDSDEKPAVRPKYTNIRSAEEAKDALLIYLGTKLAPVNDLASVSERWGADLSVIALGTGLDERLRRLFANPSLGFGGRLSLLLHWIRAERIHRATNPAEGITEEKIMGLIDAAIDKMRRGKDVAEIMERLTPNLHMLFWIENILRVNEETQKQFFKKIETEYWNAGYGSLRGKKVALLGVGYSHKSEQITQSPVLKIRKLIAENAVKDFYVTDSKPRLAAFRKLVKTLRENGDKAFQAAHFHGAEEGDSELDIYDAAESSDLAIIATDSHPDIRKINIPRLAEALGDKPLFDGVNLFGLRADGKTFPNYTFHSLRKDKINYVSVGRPNIGPRFERKNKYHLVDSRLYETGKYPIKQFDPKTDTQDVAVIGTAGYVGLNTARLLANMGHNVTGVDIDAEKVALLNEPKLQLPIEEPGLQELLQAERDAGRFRATTDGDSAIRNASMIYVAVPTNSKEDGEIDLTHILKVADQIGDVIKQGGGFKTIVIKSTVTPDAFEQIDALLTKRGLKAGKHYALASNPEFLREGQAVYDVTKPDRTIFGIYAKMPKAVQRKVARQLLTLFYPLNERHPHPVLVTDTAISTIIKYTANSALLTSITFANFLAEDTSRIEADYYEVKAALQADPRIGMRAFLECGVGFGGSCFPKDGEAIAHLSLHTTKTKHPLMVVRLASGANEYFQLWPVRQIVSLLPPPLDEKTIGGLGLAFKQFTDDSRKAPSALILFKLLHMVRQIRVHDLNLEDGSEPGEETFMRNYLRELHEIFVRKGAYQDPNAGDLTGRELQKYLLARFGEFFKRRYLHTGKIVFVKDPMQTALRNKEKGWAPADAVIIMTEWAQYADDAHVDWKRLAEEPQKPVIIDGRNVLYKKPGGLETLRENGIGYRGVGVQGFPARSEAREAEPLNPKLRQEVDNLRFSNDSTDSLAENFTHAKFSGRSLPELEGRYPELAEKRSVAEEIAAAIYGKDLFQEISEIDAWRFLQLILIEERRGEAEAGEALQVAREALGDYAWLLDTRRAPIHLVEPVDGPVRMEDYPGLMVGLDPRDTFTLIVPGADLAEVKRIKNQFAERARRLKLPIFGGQYQVIGTDGASAGGRIEIYRAIQRLARGQEKRTLGAFKQDRGFLERLGSRGKMARVYNEGRLEKRAAILVTAALLREQFANHYDIVNLESWLAEKGIDMQVLVERVGRMIANLNRLATQA